MRNDQRITNALEATGLPWEIEPGARHRKIKLAGRLVGIMSLSGSEKADRRSVLNVVSQIRRMARELAA